MRRLNMMAGVACCDPMRLTLRELVDRYEGVIEQRWAETSRIESMIYNMNRSKDADEKLPRDFNPLFAGRVEELADAYWDALERAK